MTLDRRRRPRHAPRSWPTPHGRPTAAYLRTIRRVRDNILAFQSGILHRDATMRPAPGVELTLRYRPLRRVGVCIPGGAAAYPSSLLMTVVPAQAAGVEEIAVVVPPTALRRLQRRPAGRLPRCSASPRSTGSAAPRPSRRWPTGSRASEPVDKIVGPGNLFVALAKRQVYGEVDIDSIAGPSEVVLIADWTAEPEYVAADLISQAEHSPGASVLITWEADLIDRVAEALDRQLAHAEPGRPGPRQPRAVRRPDPRPRRGRGGRADEPDRPGAPARLDDRPRPARRAPDQRRRDLPRPR